MSLRIALAALALCTATQFTLAQTTGDSVPSTDAPKEVSVASPAPQDSNTYSSITTRNYRNYVGVGVGSVAGYGLSWRHWNKKATNGFQINVLPWYKRDSLEGEYYDRWSMFDSEMYSSYDSAVGTATSGMLSLGAIWLHSIHNGRYLHFINYAGGQLNIDYVKNDFTYGEDYWDYYGSSSTTRLRDTTYRFDKQLTLGGGLGLEVYVWRFSISPMLGLQAIGDISTREFSILPTAELAVHFRL